MKLTEKNDSLISIWLLLAIPLILIISAVSMDRGEYYWESVIIRSVLERVRPDASILSQLLISLDWSTGVLSASQASLLWGFIAKVLTNCGVFRPFYFRLISSLWALSTLVLIFLFFLRKQSSKRAAVVVFCIGTAPPFLFFSQHISSMAATFFTTCLLFILTLNLIESCKIGLWKGILAALLFYIGTLGYAGGRMVIPIFLTVILFSELRKRPRLIFRERYGIVAFFFAITGIATFHYHHGTVHNFLSGNDDQFFYMISNPERVDAFLHESLALDSFSQKIRLAKTLVQTNFPDMLRFILPTSDLFFPPKPWASLNKMPDVPLYNPFILPFFLLGLFAKPDNEERWSRRIAIIWLFTCLPAVLLTHRFDIVRAGLCSIPFSVIASIGMMDLMHVIKRHKKSPERIGIGFRLACIVFILIVSAYSLVPMLNLLKYNA